MKTMHFHIDPRGVATVTMNRPEVHNAFNLTLIDELRQIFSSLPEHTRVVVLRGAGKSFSAGADVDWMRRQSTASPEENREGAARMQALFETIDSCPRPVVARIHGAALGGGSGLTCAADIAVAHPEAIFGFTEVRLGIIPAVISPFVIRRLGYAEARYRCLTGARFGAQEAMRIGMVQQVAEDLDGAVERTIQELLAGAPGAHQRTKDLLRRVWELTYEEQGPFTQESAAAARASEEGRVGLEAFLEKRVPYWQRTPAAP